MSNIADEMMGIIDRWCLNNCMKQEETLAMIQEKANELCEGTLRVGAEAHPEVARDRQHGHDRGESQ